MSTETTSNWQEQKREQDGTQPSTKYSGHPSQIPGQKEYVAPTDQTTRRTDINQTPGDRQDRSNIDSGKEIDAEKDPQEQMPGSVKGRNL